MLAIYKREMRSYFTTPIGYIFLAIFLKSLLIILNTLSSKLYPAGLHLLVPFSIQKLQEKILSVRKVSFLTLSICNIFLKHYSKATYIK